ncbi:MAG: hypothetical protein PVJ57_03090 [Phycisphaerae bacterium]|jgi:hypothetical protein
MRKKSRFLAAFWRTLRSPGLILLLVGALLYVPFFAYRGSFCASCPLGMVDLEDGMVFAHVVPSMSYPYGFWLSYRERGARVGWEVLAFWPQYYAMRAPPAHAVTMPFLVPMLFLAIVLLAYRLFRSWRERTVLHCPCCAGLADVRRSRSLRSTLRLIGNELLLFGWPGFGTSWRCLSCGTVIWRRDRQNDAVCAECGYPRQGLPTAICPECGTAFSGPCKPGEPPADEQRCNHVPSAPSRCGGEPR